MAANTALHSQVQCDGSDGSDPHTITTSVASAGDDPEVTQRSGPPICYALYPQDPGDVKEEVPEFKGSADGRRGDFQETSEDRTRRLERIQVKRSLQSSGIPEDRPRPEQRIITVPTRDDDRRPREANA
ncbi:hypothetical protein NDU88_006169 [Pleurodeles waltl]|uniref:Uncharacterized protein n=1 Tax=Pleurodeles waltl TaxID=8319 RepID=A0AAV7PHK0_PLEWA|nr:hypothetical protein NDU88_006169 [Pleurodeles waltl]